MTNAIPFNIFPADAVPGDDAATLQIANDADLAALAKQGAFKTATRIELNFPKFTDGRAYSQAIELRRRHGWQGEIRATGDVLVDQLLLMKRCGFTSAVLAPGLSADIAQHHLERFGDFYQGDAQKTQPRFAREAA